ncbi:MAG TPA: MXAN_6640 family putative metalloprotease [Candidatus Didemnitutus sp.]|nr:MXAN_6640 family putative metalloprotease [Candidatus Didemnitutus sp.]
MRTTPEQVRKVQAGIQAIQRPSLPFFVDATSGLFRVHYATTGPDAVSVVDGDGNAVPDYIDECIRTLEHVYRAEIDTLGYLPPPSDGGEGGNGAIDVYVRDLSQAGPSGSSLYGITTLDKLIGSQPIDRYTTWMDIDNNFAESDRDLSGNPAYATFGIDALRVTCAHEFHHVIQIGRYGLAVQQRMFYELSSTWMELRVWPDVRDWAIYASELFADPERWPFSDPDVVNGYVWGWYGNVMAGISTNSMRFAWENIAQGTMPAQAVVNAYAQSGANFRDVFCAQLPTFYQTGSRGEANTVIPGAESVPEIRLYTDERAIAPSVISSGFLRAFEVRALRFSVPSASGDEPVSVAVILTWPNESAYIAGDATSATSYTVTVTESPLPTDAIVPGTSWGIRVAPESICVVLDGAQTRKPASPYPQPLSISATRELFVPVANGSPGEKVTLTLMTVSTIGMAATTSTVMLDGDRIVAPFELPDDLAPGTYLVRVESKGTSTLLKISVRR